MSLSPSSILPGRVYSHTTDRDTTLYRRVINTGTWTECTSPACRRPLRRAGAQGYGEDYWVRYETVIKGLLLVRACTLASFIRWAEKREPARRFIRPPLTFTPFTTHLYR